MESSPNARGHERPGFAHKPHHKQYSYSRSWVPQTRARKFWGLKNRHVRHEDDPFKLWADAKCIPLNIHEGQNQYPFDVVEVVICAHWNVVFVGAWRACSVFCVRTFFAYHILYDHLEVILSHPHTNFVSIPKHRLSTWKDFAAVVISIPIRCSIPAEARAKMIIGRLTKITTIGEFLTN